MNKYFIIGLILSNLICSCLSKTFDTKMKKIVVNDVDNTKNKEKSINNDTRVNFDFIEDNENSTDLKKKSNGYWKIFLTIFILSFAFSGGYVCYGFFSC